MARDPFLDPSQDRGGPQMPSLKAGQWLFQGRFQLVEQIGSGGMGLVWLAVKHPMESRVALKFLPTLLVRQDREMQRLKDEVSIGRELRHDHIVATYDLEQEEGIAAIVMEYVEGRDLKELLEARESGFFEPGEVATWVRHIAEALTYLHEKKARTHRDVKPANIKIDSQGSAKLLDFGLSHRIRESLSRHTQAGAAQTGTSGSGTLPYMSPQQLTGKPAHPADDIYSLGATLYELLTGTQPFFRGGLEAVTHQIKSEPVTPIMERRQELKDEGLNASLGAQVPPRVEKAVMDCLAKEREARPKSALLFSESFTSSDPKPPDGLSEPVDGWKPAPASAPAQPGSPAPDSGHMEVLKLPPEELATILGPGGSRLKHVQEVTGASIHLEEDGTVRIRAPEILNVRSAVALLEQHLETVVPGKNYTGKVVRLTQFGVFMSLPGNRDGLIHISDLAHHRVTQVEDVVKVGDSITAKCLSIDEKGRVKLSRKALLSAPLQEPTLEKPKAGNPRNLSLRMVAFAGVLGVFAFLGFLRVWDDAGIQDEGLEKRSPAAVQSTTLPPDSVIQTSSPGSPTSATKHAPFVNSLGMKFVPVPIGAGPSKGQRILFSVWETRSKDYAAFVKDSGHDAGDKWKTGSSNDVPVGRGEGERAEESSHPVAYVSHDDAVAFCAWLTKRDRASGLLGPQDEYRLPSDVEWSYAVGIGDKEDASASPEEKDDKLADIYPWGSTWPPPAGSGNYADETANAKGTIGGNFGLLEHYTDGYPTTAPVGSFRANVLGIHDLGGNLWEWNSSFYRADDDARVLRGGSWGSGGRFSLASSLRDLNTPEFRNISIGFRCVLVAPGG